MAAPRRNIYHPEARSLREEPRKKLALTHKILVWLALVCGLMLSLSMVARVESFQIVEVQVRGAHVVPEEKVVEVAENELRGFYGYLFPKRNMLLYPRARIEEEIAATFSRVARVSVHREGSVLVADLAERKTSYALCAENFTAPCYAVDAGGYVFDGAPEFTGGILFTLADAARAGVHASTSPIGGAYAAPRDILRLEHVARAFIELFRARDLEYQLLGVEVTAEADFSAVFSGYDHRTHLLFRDGDPAVLASNLALALDTPGFTKKMTELGPSHLRLVDLRFGKKVYYTFATSSPSH